MDIVKVARLTGLFYMVAFLVVGLLFLIGGEYLIKIINQIAPLLSLNPIPDGEYSLWWILSIAMMGNITLISYFIYKDPIKNKNLFPPLILCKLLSALVGLGLFFSSYAFGHILVFITDFPLGIWAWVLYRKI